MKPFASEFGSFERELHSQSKQVEHQIRLAAEMAADRERKLQTIHRDESVSYWRRARHEVDQAKAWRRQTEEHALSKFTQYETLFSLCSREYFANLVASEAEGTSFRQNLDI